MMAGLKDFAAGAVLRADDLARAKDFYVNKLGLVAAAEGESVTDELRLLAGKGTTVDIYARPGMPAPANTTLGFGVPLDRFDDVMSELKAAGVVFEEYDMPEIGLKTVGGVTTVGDTKAAWFKDSEGNVVILASE